MCGNQCVISWLSQNCSKYILQYYKYQLQSAQVTFWTLIRAELLHRERMQSQVGYTVVVQM